VAEDIDFGNPEYASAFSGTSLMIFDDVFVPKERIFMDGECEFTGTLIRRFGSLARMWEGGCRPGLIDLLLGASACITEYNGIEGASHVVDKLSHLALLAETAFSSAMASTMYPEKSASGIYFPDIRLVSVSKFHTINGMYEACKLANDLAGALTITMPSEKDYKNPETHEYIEKYLQGKAGVPTEHRIRMFRFIESITSGSDACALHYGGATLQPHLFNLWRYTNFDELKKRVKVLSKIEKGE
jgi:4-hydroxybutyryl-CoA dehydratase/vinylacetyl-CoA-Delta-isomerase